MTPSLPSTAIPSISLGSRQNRPAGWFVTPHLAGGYATSVVRPAVPRFRPSGGSATPTALQTSPAHPGRDRPARVRLAVPHLRLPHLRLLDGFQIPQDLRPFGGDAGGGEALLQLLAQDEGEERTEDVPPDRGIRLVVNRPRAQDRLGGPEDLFHEPKLPVLAGHLGGRQVGVGAQHADAVELRLGGDPVVVDLDVIVAHGAQEAPPAAGRLR